MLIYGRRQLHLAVKDPSLGIEPRRRIGLLRVAPEHQHVRICVGLVPKHSPHLVQVHPVLYLPDDDRHVVARNERPPLHFSRLDYPFSLDFLADRLCCEAKKGLLAAGQVWIMSESLMRLAR
jgi:hypothetical protein